MGPALYPRDGNLPLSLTIKAGPTHRQRITGRRHPNRAGEFLCGLYQPLSSSSRWLRGIPRSSEAFFGSPASPPHAVSVASAGRFPAPVL